MKTTTNRPTHPSSFPAHRRTLAMAPPTPGAGPWVLLVGQDLLPGRQQPSEARSPAGGNSPAAALGSNHPARIT